MNVQLLFSGNKQLLVYICLPQKHSVLSLIPSLTPLRIFYLTPYMMILSKIILTWLINILCDVDKIMMLPFPFELQET